MCTAGSGSDPAAVGTSRHASVVLLRGSTSTADCRGPAKSGKSSMRNGHQNQAGGSMINRKVLHVMLFLAEQSYGRPQVRPVCLRADSAQQFTLLISGVRTSKHEACAVNDGGCQGLLQRAAASIQRDSVPAQPVIHSLVTSAAHAIT